MQKKKSNTLRPGKNAVPLREKLFGAMLLIVVAIMPLVTRHAVVIAAPELIALLGESATFHSDFFAMYKGWVLGIPAIAIAFYVVADWLIGGLTKDRVIAMIKPIPIAAACVFLFMALVSTIFSSFRHTAWFGAVDRYEGLFMLFAYFIVFFTAMHYVKADKQAKIVMYGLAFSSVIMGLIGLSQFIGRDFFGTSLGARIVMGNWDDALNQTFQIAYGTLYNPNTFGKYTAMTAPIMLACALAYDGRKWVRAVFLAGGLLMLVGVMGSSSVGGLIGIATAAMVFAITFICRFIYQARLRKKEQEEGRRSHADRNILAWGISGAVLVALLIGLVFVPTVNERLHFLLGRIEHAVTREVVPTYDYIIDGDTVTVVWQDEERFSIVLIEEAYEPRGAMWHVYDASGQLVSHTSRTTPPRPEEGGPAPPWPITFAYDIPGYGAITVDLWDDVLVVFRGLAMLRHEGRVHALAPNADMIDLAVPVAARGFYGNETWGSSRGHIWSRTFPLMPSTAIIGTGPDTYTLVFPQHDFLGKLSFHLQPYIPIDKAHNLYLQTWVTTGGISALALIFLFGYYLLTSFVSIVRSRMEEGMFVFGLRFGLLCGIAAFCISALATDSTIGSSGVFYLLLGLGFGVNKLVDGLKAA